MDIRKIFDHFTNVKKSICLNEKHFKFKPFQLRQNFMYRIRFLLSIKKKRESSSPTEGSVQLVRIKK